MNINIDYKRTDDATKDTANADLSINYITYAVEQKYKDGLSGSLRRLYGRIQRKLDDALESNSYDIDLEEAEKDFLKDAFRDAKFPSGTSKYVILLEDEINKL